MLLWISLLACTPDESAEPDIVEPISSTRSSPNAAVALTPEQRRLADGRLPLVRGTVEELPDALKADLDPNLHATLLAASNQSYGACASCIEQGRSAAECYGECPAQQKVSWLAGQMLADGADNKLVLDSFKFKQGWVDIPELKGPILEGKPSAGGAVTLWVVLDYESPFAADSWQAALDIQAEYPELSVRPLFWHPERHESAGLAARAAFAASEQGKFEEMNALLLKPEASLDRMALVTMGESLDLDMAKFRAAMVDAPLRKSVQSHVNAGQAVGVRGLPCYFVNGWRIRGVPLHEQVARLVALEKIP